MIEKLLQNVVDEMLEGLQVISPDWRYVYVNDTVARQGKTAKEKLIGRTMMECYPGIDRTPLFEQLKKSMEARVNIRMENEFAYPDGSKGWFQLFIHPVNEGIMILSVDITDRKLAEEALRNKIEELDNLINVAVSREVRMAELKRTVFELKGLTSATAPIIEQP